MLDLEALRKDIEAVLPRYPAKRSALLPALWAAQKQEGYISDEAIVLISKMLEVPALDVAAVISFYSLFRPQPAGKHLIRICTCLPCWLRGCDEVVAYAQQLLGIKVGQTTEDGQITLEAAPECLGACEIAPMMEVDEQFRGPVSKEMLEEVIEELRSNKGQQATGTQNPPLLKGDRGDF